MRIALTHPRASDLGGVERQAHSVAVALIEAGHQVHYFCQHRDETVDRRIQFHRVPDPVRPFRAVKVWLFDALCQRAVERAGPFDLVHGFGKTSRQDVYYDGSGCLADFQAYSIDTLPSAWRRRLRRASLHQRVVARIERERYTRGNFRRIIAISGRVRHQILRRYRLDPEEVEVLYPGVDLERFTPELAPAARHAVRDELGLPPESPLLLFLGSDYRRKGLPALLAALGNLPEAHLLVVGRNRRAESYRRLSARLGLGERVHFLGMRRDPERTLAAADCLVLPTHFDAFGSAVLEAMASGIPAVVSRNAGAAELVLEGKTGSVVDDPADPAALAKAIRPLLDRGVGEEAGRLARREAEGHGWHRHVGRVLEIYGEIL